MSNVKTTEIPKGTLLILSLDMSLPRPVNLLPFFNLSNIHVTIISSQLFRLACVSVQVEQIAQLQSFVDAQTEYHRQALDILQELGETLEAK